MKQVRAIALTIKRPSKDRASYTLVQDTKYFDEPRTQLTAELKPEESAALEQINSVYAKTKNIPKCDKLIEELKSRVLARLLRDNKLIEKRVFNSDNYEILEEFFVWKYTSKKTKDKDNAKNDYRRAIDALGEVSLRVGTDKQIEAKLAILEPNKQRRCASKLQQMLGYLEREIILEKDKKQRPTIRYVNETELALVLKKVSDPFAKVMFECLFYSGCRIGELFALEDDDYFEGTLNIDKQMLRPYDVVKRKLKHWRVPTKTEETRKAVLTEEFDDLFRQWMAIPIETKVERRDEKWADMLTKACIEALPGKHTKHLVVHDLRHSFAHFMKAKGASITAIANNLGNSYQVCQDYYAGKFHSAESEDHLKRLLRPAK